MNSHSAIKFVFSTIGTTGDVLPLLAVAAELVARGHDCDLLANAPFEHAARAAGIGFTALAPLQHNNVTSGEYNFATYLFPSYPKTFAYFDRAMASGQKLVVINTEDYSASNSAAERYDLPLCRIYLAPFKLRSYVEPFWPLRAQLDGVFGYTFRTRLLPRLYEQWDTYSFLVNHVNEHRVAWALPPITTMRHAYSRIRKHVALFPEWYCPRAPDWPADLEMLGFPLPKSVGQLPQALAEFIQGRGAPLVFTPGTGVPDVQEFFAVAGVCCDKLRLPGVFLSPHAARTPRSYGPRVLQWDYVDLSLLLPHSALLVHHGGIGTTARALQAGIPQVVSPLAYDQPDNGYRVTKLQAGVSIERYELKGTSLSRAARRLLESSDTRARLARIKALAAQNDAVGQCADLLEHEFAGPARASDAKRLTA